MQPPTSVVLQPVVVSEQPIKEENKTSPPPPSQLTVSFSVWAATNSGTYNFKSALLPCPEPPAALQGSGKGMPTQPGLQPRQEMSQHISARADGGVGWAALEVWVGGSGSVLSLRLPG